MIRRIESDDALLKIRKRSPSKCPYCGNKQMSDLPESPEWRISQTEREFPGAEGDFSVVDRYQDSPNSIRYIQCKNCSGLWFDIYELRSLELPPQFNDADAIKRIMKNPAVCPFCKSKRPTTEDFSVSKSGIVLNVFCPNCSATWNEKAVLVASVRIDSPVASEGVAYTDDEEEDNIELPDEDALPPEPEDNEDEDIEPEDEVEENYVGDKDVGGYAPAGGFSSIGEEHHPFYGGRIRGSKTRTRPHLKAINRDLVAERIVKIEIPTDANEPEYFNYNAPEIDDLTKDGSVICSLKIITPTDQFFNDKTEEYVFLEETSIVVANIIDIFRNKFDVFIDETIYDVDEYEGNWVKYGRIIVPNKFVEKFVNEGYLSFGTDQTQQPEGFELEKVLKGTEHVKDVNVMIEDWPRLRNGQYWTPSNEKAFYENEMSKIVYFHPVKEALVRLEIETDSNEPDVVEVDYEVGREWMAVAIVELLQHLGWSLDQIVDPDNVDQVNAGLSYSNQTIHQFTIEVPNGSNYIVFKDWWAADHCGYVIYREAEESNFYNYLRDGGYQDYVEKSSILEDLEGDVREEIEQNPADYTRFLSEPPPDEEIENHEYTIDEIDEMVEGRLDELAEGDWDEIENYFESVDSIIDRYINVNAILEGRWEDEDRDDWLQLGPSIKLPSNAVVYAREGGTHYPLEEAITTVELETDAEEPDIVEIEYDVKEEWMAVAIVEMLRRRGWSLDQIADPANVDRVNDGLSCSNQTTRQFTIEIPENEDYIVFKDRKAAEHCGYTIFRFSPYSVDRVYEYLRNGGYRNFVDIETVIDDESVRRQIRETVELAPADYIHFLSEPPPDEEIENHEYTIDEIDEMAEGLANRLIYERSWSELEENYISILDIIEAYVDMDTVFEALWENEDRDDWLQLGPSVELPSGAIVYRRVGNTYYPLSEAITTVEIETDAEEPNKVKIDYAVQEEWQAEAIVELLKQLGWDSDKIVEPRNITYINSSLDSRTQTLDSFQVIVDNNTYWVFKDDSVPHDIAWELWYKSDSLSEYIDEFLFSYDNYQQYLDIDVVLDGLRTDIQTLIYNDPDKYVRFLDNEHDVESEYSDEELDEMEEGYISELRDEGWDAILALGIISPYDLFEEYGDKAQVYKDCWEHVDINDVLQADFVFTLMFKQYNLPVYRIRE